MEPELSGDVTAMQVKDHGGGSGGGALGLGVEGGAK